MIVGNRIVFKAFPAFILADDKGNDFFEGLLSSCSPNRQ
jgi:tartrate dehydratase beta subunit/fumarate hydratase class I family protein